MIAAVLASLVPLEQSQAQLYIHVYPSQDNYTNQTLWFFSGSSTASASNSIRTSSGSSNFHNRDTWDFAPSNNNGNIYNANKPSANGENISLSSLFSSSNAKDIASVNARIPGGGKTDITFAASATNTPTITIASSSRTISHLYLKDDGSSDALGIRASGSALSYSSGNASAWTGAGIIGKPIGDFFTGTFDNRTTSFIPTARFAANNSGSIRVVVNSQVIPEPEEYALIFALFALVFVFFHRRMMQKKPRQQQPATAL